MTLRAWLYLIAGSAMLFGLMVMVSQVNAYSISMPKCEYSGTTAACIYNGKCYAGDTRNIVNHDATMNSKTAAETDAQFETRAIGEIFTRPQTPEEQALCAILLPPVNWIVDQQFATRKVYERLNFETITSKQRILIDRINTNPEYPCGVKVKNYSATSKVREWHEVVLPSPDNREGVTVCRKRE